MLKMMESVTRSSWSRRVLLAFAAYAVSWAPAPSHAYEFNTGSELKVDWTNTVKYSAAFRVAHPDSQLLGQINGDDGDRNFSRGLVSNRIDLLSEFGVRWRDYGFELSAAAWYDTVYNDDTDNNSPGTYNPFSVPNTEFTDQTRDIHGRKVELLNAFVYGTEQVGDIPVTVRVGRHTQIWGESLLFADNGISYGQAPIDIIKLTSVPNTLAKELYMPVTQVSTTAQLAPNLSLSAYYQLEWRKSRINGVGSYLSFADLLDYGGERIIGIPQGVPLGGLVFAGFTDLAGAYIYRGDDVEAEPFEAPQFGVALKYQLPDASWDFGLYALQYNDSEPQVYTNSATFDPTRNELAEYFLVYPEAIQMYGASATTTFGETNFAGEISWRHNAPFQSVDNSGTGMDVAFNPGANNRNNPLYARGESLHAQMSAIWVGKPTSMWDSVSFLGEIAGSHRLRVTDNEQNLDHSKTKSSLGFRGIFTPTYFQVYPGVDLSVPVGLGWNFMGKSSTTAVFNGGADNGGDLSVGLAVNYLSVWNAGVTYTSFIGGASRNPTADRDFVAFTLSRSF